MPDRDYVREAREYLDEAEQLLSSPPPLGCVECGCTSDQEARGWRTHLTFDDELATYCPSCAEAEFGG